MDSIEARTILAVALFTLLPGALCASGPAQPIVIEAEDLVVGAHATEGAVGSGWSGNHQLYWVAPSPNAVLALPLPVPAGNYEATLYVTGGPDYARFEVLAAGGKVPKSDVELFSPQPWRPVQVWLGVLPLGPDLGIAIHVLGHDPRSRGYAVGIDRIGLKRVAGPPAGAIPLDSSREEASGGAAERRAVR